ncbi:MAG: hypothetical protein NTZ74_01770 [Chloroflexi bacterium]|nr:hypothetical protein [Chloroflexota bacterium]
MKSQLAIFDQRKKGRTLRVLLGARDPRPQVLEELSRNPDLEVRETFSTRGVLQNLSGVQLVLLGELIALPEASLEVVRGTLERSGLPVASQEEFLLSPEEWLGRARLASSRQVNFLPARQVNFVNWSGGVGKTTLGMALCKRFVERTGLPAAFLELSLGGSALQARISPDLPEFFSIATQKEPPALWNGVSLYPMDGRTIEVLWNEDPGGVRLVVEEIQRKHTLFVVDCFPGHPLFADLSKPRSGLIHVVVTSPRDDAVMQARRLIHEIAEPRIFVMNMARSLADRAERGLSLVLPYNENWAKSLSPRLADPVLEWVYPGWKGRRGITTR